jgi:hypothetical protein
MMIPPIDGPAMLPTAWNALNRMRADMDSLHACAEVLRDDRQAPR